MHRLEQLLLQFIGTPDAWWWLGVTVIAIAFAYLSLRALRTRRQWGAAQWIGALAVLAIVYGVLNARATPTGDEPHYLLMAQSIVRDGDLDLRNNYENRDYLQYYPASIPDPHIIVVENHWYPVHGLGLPLLVAPFFALGGRPAVVGLLVLLSIAGLGVLWSAIRRAGFGRRPASVAALVAGFTLPLASLSGQVFPEVPALLLVAIALRAAFAPPLGGWVLGGLVVSLAYLPWLHPKYVALAGALLLSAAVAHPRRRALGALALAATAFTVSVAGLATLSYHWYGLPLPGAAIVVPEPTADRDWQTAIVGHFLVDPWVGMAGVLFDQHSGILIASPVYVLALPGAWLLWQRRRALAVATVLVFASVYLLAGSFGVWYGGFSSPARLMTPAVPVLTLAIAAVLERGDSRRWRVFAVLAIPSFVHAYLMTALPSFTRYGDPVTQHNYFISLFERVTGFDLTPFFPSFRNLEPLTWLTTGVYLIGIGLLSWRLVRQERGQPAYEGR